MRFSERMGFTPVKELIQVDSMDDDLRVGLWNTFNSVIIDSYTARVPFPYIQTSNHRDFFEKFIVHQWGNY
ncbi:hypothetical protein N3930_38350, partial [Bacillus thuringiensis]|nr:hypothetical protein [Bacillus thuringiensis]